ncbi:Golgi apparatus membrane protein tvp18 [Kappamyces sp. JEL0829]|nr:Golgi apparatus membrane protein tvp18 [Kappamyces sp. JEL0829]KAJ3359627.1 Golgi apparatus membrane protein tvp18 [Kappamyces sp. JEL0680]
MGLWDGFMNEVKSGKMSVYGQWLGWLSGILLIIFGITQILSVPVFAILAFVEGAFIFLLECPFVTQCLRNTDRIIAISKDNRIKCGIYVVFATLMWLSLVQTVNSILISAISQTAAAVCYGIAVYRGEEGGGSNFVNRQNIAQTAIQHV